MEPVITKSLDENVRTVIAIHGRRKVAPDPSFERELSLHLKAQYSPPALRELSNRFADGDGEFDGLMRRAIWRALAQRFGDGVRIAPRVGSLHLETFEIGDG